MEGLELLRAVRKQITEHPETHNQGTWSRRTECGTTRCIAGWAVALSAVEWYSTAAGGMHLASGRTVEETAERLLGLDWDEASDLFYEWDADDALEMLNGIIEAREAEAHQSDQA